MGVSKPPTSAQSFQFQAYWNSVSLGLNYEDFWGTRDSAGNLLGANWSPVFAGAGAALSFLTATTEPPGVARLSTGTTATGGGAMVSTFTALKLSPRSMRFSSRFRLPTLSDGSDRYTIRTGVGATIAASGNIDNGIYAEYTDNVNGGALQLVASIGGVKTIANGVTPLLANAWNYLEFQYDAAPLQCVLFLNGAQECFVLEGFPANTTNMAIGAGQIIKSVGLNARFMDLDAVFLGYGFLAKR